MNCAFGVTAMGANERYKGEAGKQRGRAGVMFSANVTLEAAQTVPLLDLERADVQRCWARPAHLFECRIRKCFV